MTPRRRWSWPPFPVAYAVCLVAVIFVECALWPIISYDTDLWYHLNGGRYIALQHAIPTDSFFSFVTPLRLWVDYYWLFQVLLFQVFTHAGFYGLIALRTAVAIATLGLVFWFVFTRRPREVPWTWLAAVGFGCVFVLLPRMLAVRPHLFTYLFMAAFLGILEHRPRWALALPVVGFCWMNLHGITYPVMWVICGAYGMEYLWGRRRADANRRMVLTAIGLAMATVLLTPHGLRLLPVPFVSTAGASEYINELKPVQLGDLLSLHLVWLTPTIQTLFNLYLYTALVVCGVALWHRTAAISQVALFAAGCALLLKGGRFGNEFVLMALPLLRSHTLAPRQPIWPHVPRLAYLAALFLVLLMPLQIVAFFFNERPAYPVSYRGLPKGVVAFLRQADTGGRLLNHPNQGGYYQWMLWPRYRIFMDMEIPFLFHDGDMRVVLDALSQPHTLGRVLERYRPPFIAVPLGTTGFPKVISEFPEYAMVFFDDAEVLYASRQAHPELVRAYEIRALKPFEFFTESSEELLKKLQDHTAFMRELRRLLAVYPEAGMANRLAGLVYNKEGAYDRALPFAYAVQARSPEAPAGYELEADALKGLGAYRRAIAAYRRAIEHSVPSARAPLYRNIGICWFELGRYGEAYRDLNRSISVYGEPSEEDLYFLGAAAVKVGRHRQAEDIMQYLKEYRGDAHSRGGGR